MPRKGMGSIFWLKSSSPTFSPKQKRISLSPALYSYSQTMIDETLVKSSKIIKKWNLDTTTYIKVTSLFYENHEEAQEFLKSVRDLQRAMKYLVTKDPNSDKLVKAQKLMQIAMKRLEKEFYTILSTNHDRLDPESISSKSCKSYTSEGSRSSVSDFEEDEKDDIQVVGESISEMEGALAAAMFDLKSIADCMFSSGYAKECVSIYKVTRKSIIDEGIYKIGVNQYSAKKIDKMDWENLELMTKNWLKAAMPAVKTLFAGERILCDYVFSSSDSMRESCFSNISRNGAIILFQFPELVAKSKKKSERIFRILDLYIGIADLWADIETIFSFESTNIVINQALSSLQSLGNAVREMIYDFETMIQKSSLKPEAQGGGVHSLTQYVMRYLAILSNYSGVFSDIIAEWPIKGQSSLPESYQTSFTPKNNDVQPITTAFAWLILALLCKLDSKAEVYKEAPLSYLFLANNLHYIVRKVRTSNLGLILGEEWISKHEANIRHYITKYEKLGWSKVLSMLPEDPNSDLTALEAKNCFKRFSSAFQVTCRTQSYWIVSDRKLRDEIKVLIIKIIRENYNKFYDKHQVILRDDRLSSLVTLNSKDIENYVSDLFFGSRISGSYSTSSSSSPSPRHFSGWSL